MKDKQKSLNLLGLAMRARSLVTGSSLVMDAIRTKKVKFVVVSADASEETKKQFLNKSEYYQVPLCIEFTSNEISQAIGRERKVCAFTDDGFAKSFKKLLHEEER